MNGTPTENAIRNMADALRPLAEALNKAAGDFLKATSVIHPLLPSFDVRLAVILKKARGREIYLRRYRRRGERMRRRK